MNKPDGALEEFFQTLDQEQTELVDLYLAPAFTMLPTVCAAANMRKFKVLAQNVHHQLQGAYTGEVSSLMLRELGVAGAIIGHSERRIHCHEDDELINAKLQTCIQQGLTPVLCVGETAAQRADFRAVLRQQTTLSGVDISKVVFAYEPVWAIGTGDTASDEHIHAVHAYLRSITATTARILYGGSVNANNARSLLNIAGVDGLLVGGASLVAASLLAICRATP